MAHSEDFRSVPWRKLFVSPSAWALCLQWFCHYFGFYFYITWLPTYLQQSRGLNLAQGAALAGLPMFSAAMENKLMSRQYNQPPADQALRSA